MPKRLIDGEAVWGSEKLRRVFPEKWRAEYTNLLPLALANGVFECEPAKVWSRVYAFNRPRIKPKHVEEILSAYEAAGMLFRWKEEEKTWGYFVGIEKRLPDRDRAEKLRLAVGPYPPIRALQAYVRKGLDGDGSYVATTEQLPICSDRLGMGRLGKGRVGLAGVGEGCGEGKGNGQGQQADSQPTSEIPVEKKPLTLRQERWLKVRMEARAGRHPTTCSPNGCINCGEPTPKPDDPFCKSCFVKAQGDR